MAYTFTMKVFDESYFYSDYSTSWQGLIAQTLRGSLIKSKSGATNTFEDACSGLEVTVTQAGGFVTALKVTGPAPKSGVLTDTTLIDATVETGAIKAKALLSAFNSYANTSGASTKLANLFDDASYDITTVSTSSPVEGHLFGAVLTGGKGDDIFRFDQGERFAYASRGNDEYIGTASDYNTIHYDSLGGGLKMTRSGDDRIIEKPGGEMDTLRGIEGIFGTEGNDNFKVGLGSTVSQIWSHGGNDVVGGGKMADFLNGGAGDDKLLGRAGDDLLVGSGGNDFLNGGGGNDVLFASDGYGFVFQIESDTMKGGGGKDLFVIEAASFGASGTGITTIRDFKDGTDFIGLIGRDFNIFDNTDNMVFDDLTFSDSADGAVISHNGRDVAVLRNVEASDLSRKDFVELVSIDQELNQFALTHEAFIF